MWSFTIVTSSSSWFSSCWHFITAKAMRIFTYVKVKSGEGTHRQTTKSVLSSSARHRSFLKGDPSCFCWFPFICIHKRLQLWMLPLHMAKAQAWECSKCAFSQFFFYTWLWMMSLRADIILFMMGSQSKWAQFKRRGLFQAACDQ